MVNAKQIANDIEKALRGGDEMTLQTLRMLSSQIHNKEIEKRAKGGDSTLTEEEIVEIIVREVKKRREAAELYRKGNRIDLASKEDRESVILSQYLPEQLSDSDIEKIIADAIVQSGALTDKDFGKVMGIISKQIKGKADAKRISEIVKNKLSS